MKMVYWQISLLLFKQGLWLISEQNAPICIFTALSASKASANMLNITLLFDDDGIFDELRPGVPQLSVYSVQKLTSTRALQLFPLLHLQLRRLLLDLLACSYLAGESSGEIWNSWLGKPRATHTRLLQRLFSELRHRSNYTHIYTATRFWTLQGPADARRECQTWPNLKIILFSPGSTVWSSSRDN